MTSAKRVNAVLLAVVATAAILLLALGGVFVGSRLNPIDSTPSPELTQPPVTPAADSTTYALVYALDGDLHIARPDGTNPNVIVEGGPEGECVSVHFGSGNGFVSPDRRYLAYRSCSSTVVVADLEGRNVTSFLGDGWNLAWSPDSTRIATWLSIWESDETIGVYGLDGVLQATLDGSRMCCGDYDPIWSHDGASLLVQERAIVWELPLDGGAPRPVPTDDVSSNLGSDWPLHGGAPLTYSPDNSRVAFIEGDAIGAFRTGDLVVADSDGAERQVLIRNPGHQFSAPMWSPVDHRIVFPDADVTVNIFRGSVDVESIDLRVADVRTGVVSTLFTRASGVLEPLGFSPDGESILVAVGTEAHEEVGASLWSVASDGSGAQMVVDGTSVGGWVTLPADAEMQ